VPSVTRKPQAKRQERREEIERQLLDATERLMAAGASFTELSVDRLATEAGISRASFYIYFEDKGYLLRRLTGQPPALACGSVAVIHPAHDLD